jgi:hypothetical protein
MPLFIFMINLRRELLFPVHTAHLRVILFFNRAFATFDEKPEDEEAVLSFGGWSLEP